jgi:hypothetical protein
MPDNSLLPSFVFNPRRLQTLAIPLLVKQPAWELSGEGAERNSRLRSRTISQLQLPRWQAPADSLWTALAHSHALACTALCQVSALCWLKGFQKTGPLSSDRSENSSTASSSNTTAPGTDFTCSTGQPLQAACSLATFRRSPTHAQKRTPTNTNRQESHNSNQNLSRNSIAAACTTTAVRGSSFFACCSAFHASNRPQISAACTTHGRLVPTVAWPVF